tara:strand:- start:337 stop:456 length:120 start_codon:yes stop_codon:yes gene_type:complete
VFVQGSAQVNPMQNTRHNYMIVGEKMPNTAGVQGKKDEI